MASRSALFLAFALCLAAVIQTDAFENLHQISKRQQGQVQALMRQMQMVMTSLQRDMSKSMAAIQQGVVAELQKIKQCQASLVASVGDENGVCSR